MRQEPAPVGPDNVVRQSQIVTFALIGGALSFTAVALVANWNNPAGDPDLLTWLGVVTTVMAIVLSLVVPQIVSANLVSQAARAPAEELSTRLSQAYFTKVLIGNAILEGSSFLNLVFYITSEHVLNLGSALFLTALMVFRFPTQSRFEAWLEQIQRDRD